MSIPSVIFENFKGVIDAIAMPMRLIPMLFGEKSPLHLQQHFSDIAQQVQTTALQQRAFSGQL
jgi:hypothetical protein